MTIHINVNSLFCTARENAQGAKSAKPILFRQLPGSEWTPWLGAHVLRNGRLADGPGGLQVRYPHFISLSSPLPQSNFNIPTHPTSIINPLHLPH